MLKMLLEAGADPNVRIRWGLCPGVALGGAGYPYDCYRPLDVVLRVGGSMTLVELLLQHGASVQRDPESLSHPLESAIRASNVKAVERLLKAGARPDERSVTDLRGLSEHGYVEQSCDCWEGHPSVTTHKINGQIVEDSTPDDGSDDDLGIRFSLLQLAADRIGTTAAPFPLPTFQHFHTISELTMATRAGIIVTRLRDAGAEDDLYTAVSMDEPERIERLLQQGQELPFPNWQDALLNRAVQLGNVAALETLLNNGFDANSLGCYRMDDDTDKEIEGESLLTRAVKTKHIGLVWRVIEAGADPTGVGKPEQTQAGQGPLATAVKTDAFEIVDMLLQECPEDEVRRVIEHLTECEKALDRPLSPDEQSDLSWTYGREQQRALIKAMRAKLTKHLESKNAVPQGMGGGFF